MSELTILSLGAGVQSTTMLLMALEGLFDKVPDCAIFADTGYEPKSVYKHLDWLVEKVKPFPVHIVSVGNIKEDTLAGRLPRKWSNQRKAFNTIPVYTVDKKGQVGIGRRLCTQEYKLNPIRHKTRELMIEHKVKQVETWIGISYDESAFRMKTAKVKYVLNRWPLVEKKLTRIDCLNWLKTRGVETVGKSACICCPFHNDAQWRDLQLNSPDEFADVVEFEKFLIKFPGSTERLYLNRRTIPLDQIDFRSEEEHGQLNMFEMECEGMCGV
jgi:hypothetical protein